MRFSDSAESSRMVVSSDHIISARPRAREQIHITLTFTSNQDIGDITIDTARSIAPRDIELKSFSLPPNGNNHPPTTHERD